MRKSKICLKVTAAVQINLTIPQISLAMSKIIQIILKKLEHVRYQTTNFTNTLQMSTTLQTYNAFWDGLNLSCTNHRDHPK